MSFDVFRTLLPRKVAVTLFLLQFAVGLLHPSAYSFSRQVPLSLDVIDPDRSLDEVLKPYMIGLRKRIEKRWIPNVLSPKRTAKVYFMILQNGTIPKAEITQSSGDSAFDASAVKALEDSCPLPQIPAEVMNVEATFDNRYVSAEALQANIQRMQLRLARSSSPMPAPQFQQPVPQYQAPTPQYSEPPITHRQPVIYQDKLTNRSDWSSEAPNQYGSSPPNDVREEPPNQTENSSENGYCPPIDVQVQFDHPINSAQFRQLSAEQRKEYKSWLCNVWLKSPMSDELRPKIDSRKAAKKK